MNESISLHDRYIVIAIIQWLLLCVAGFGELSHASELTKSAINLHGDIQLQMDIDHHRFVTNRTCNADSLYSLDKNTHYDHFANDSCGRHISNLIIRFSCIHYIPARFFIHKTSFEHLVTLQMENVSLKEIHQHDFENITHLETLKLAGNHIQHIPAHVFRHMTALHTVDLAHNAIDTIDAQAFRGCSKLVHLQLNGNQLTMVMADWFRDMRFIKYIDLSDNLIESDFDGDIFVSVHGLKLLMRSNRIKRIISFGNRISGPIFRLIDLSGNTLRPPYPSIPIRNHSLSVIY